MELTFYDPPAGRLLALPTHICLGKKVKIDTFLNCEIWKIDAFIKNWIYCEKTKKYW